MRLNNLTESEIEFLLSKCNFVNFEKDIFLGRARGKSLIEISLDLSISIDYARKLSQKVNRKILKTLSHSSSSDLMLL